MSEFEANKITVSFLPVGSADSTVIMCGDKVAVIDTGRYKARNGGKYGGKITADYLNSLGIKKIDYLIASHLHADHAEGWKKFIQEGFEIRGVYVSEYAHLYNQYEKRLECIANKNIPIYELKQNDTIDMNGVIFKVMAPKSNIVIKKYEEHCDTNNLSLIVRMTYGNTAFLFTGDSFDNTSDFQMDKWMMEEYTADELSSNVIKMPHHGLCGFEIGLAKKIINDKKAVYAIVTASVINSRSLNRERFAVNHGKFKFLKTMKGLCNTLILKYPSLGIVTFETDGTSLHCL